MSEAINNRSIGQALVWSLLNKTASQIMVLGVFLITARLVPKEDFGRMAIAILVYEFFRQTIIESVGTSLTAKHHPTTQDYNAGFVLTLFGSIIAVIAILALSHPIASILNDSNLILPIQIVCLMLLPMGLIKAQEVWLIKNLQFRTLALRSILSISIGGAAGIYLATHGFGITSLITQQLLTAFFGFCFLWLSTPWRPSFKTTKTNISNLSKRAAHVTTNAVVAFGSTQMDVFFTSYYLGAVSAGVLNAAKRILMALQMMTTAGLNEVALPLLSHHSQETADLKRAYINCISLTAVLTLPMYVGFSLLSEDIVLVLLGEKWNDVSPIISIIAAYSFIWSIEQYNANIFLVRDKPHWRTAVTASRAICTILILIILAPRGLTYVAWGIVLGSILLYPVSLFLALRLVNANFVEYLRTVLPIASAAAVMGIVIYSLRNWIELGHVLNLILLVPIGISLYGISIYALNRPLAYRVMTTATGLVKRA